MRFALIIVGIAGLLVGGYLAFRPSRPVPPAGRPGLRTVWVFEAPRAGAVVARPRVGRDAVFLAAAHFKGFHQSGAVYALDRATGRPRWVFDSDEEMLPTASSPLLVGDRLYFGEGMHANFVCRFRCLDAKTGKELWSFKTGDHAEGEPTEDGGTVYFAAGNDGLYAVDAASGDLRWNFRADLHLDSCPCVTGGRVYVGSGPSRRLKDLQVACLDARTGNPVWRTPVDLPAWGSPVVAGSRVFVGLGNGRLTHSASPPETPAGGLACLDAATGRHLWTFPAGDAVFGRPVPLDDRVVFASRDGNLYCVSHEGRELFRVPMGGPVVAGAAAHEGRVYAVSVPGRVVCLNPANGEEFWRHELGGGGAEPLAFASPTLSGNRLHVAAEMRVGTAGVVTLYCFELPSTGSGGSP